MSTSGKAVTAGTPRRRGRGLLDDLRLPIGLYFSAVGLILTILGLTRPELRAALTGTNVNLYSGVSILIFGSVMLWLARRAS